MNWLLERFDYLIFLVIAIFESVIVGLWLLDFFLPLEEIFPVIKGILL